MQPTFNPWLGYFDMIDQSDVFVIYDDVQLERSSWQIRNRIKTHSGELMLSIPIKNSKHFDELRICDCIVDEVRGWRKKHLRTFENAYRRSSYFEEVYEWLKGIYQDGDTSLRNFNSRIIREVCEKTGISSKFVFSSDLGEIPGSKDARLASLCKLLGISKYVSPQGSASYIERESEGGELGKAGIDVYYFNYQHPTYNQLHGEFLAYMGVFDLLFNEGFSNSAAIIRSGRRELIHTSQFRKEFLIIQP